MSAITTTTGYELVETDRLLDDIRKQSRRARAKGEEMIQSMKTAGLMLIELKARTKHGFFLLHASSSTGLHERTIQRYMEMAKGVPPLKTVISRERVKGKGDTLLLIKATEFLPEESTPKTDTASGLSENDSTPPASQATIEADITLDAGVIEKDDHREDEATAPEAQVDENEQSPAPAAPSAHLQVLHLLPDLDQDELADVIRVINTRWIRK